MTKRNEISDKYKWNVELMYPDESKWAEDIERCLKMSDEFRSYRGRLTDSADTLLEALTDMDTIGLLFEHAFVYARMKRDEDNTLSRYQAMTDRCMSAGAKISSDISFFVPELLLDPEKVRSFISENDGLKVYRHHLEDILRGKDHILTGSEEELMAKMSELLNAPDDIFTMLNDADMRFGEINGEPLTHGNYISFMENRDRSIRKKAFEHMYSEYKKHINTLASSYSYSVKNDVVVSRIRKYSSSRASALFSDDVSEEVYDNLVSVVHDYLPVLHRYIGLRKRILGVDKLKMYDIYVPLIDIPEKKVTFEDSVATVKEALKPMGEEYIGILSKGIEDRWVDVYENEGKTSGAYSFGSFDSYPYVLMNHSGRINDTFTLIHELGHSMHSAYTRANQPYVYGSHSIFTAEVASTVNECLLMKYLLEHETDPEMRRYILNMYIEAFRTTLFRQVMFAEFEHMTHKAVEEGETLTADWLNERYNELNKEYFGEALSDDEWIRYEWSRIPHFYSAFYVYKYATGYSAACALSESIINNGPDRYIEFLKSGESNYPIPLLKLAGVDMERPEAIRQALDIFGSLVDEFEKSFEV